MKLSVVIPARNEAGNIGATVEKLRLRLRQAAIPYEIIVVDDGSQDTTATEVEQLVMIDPGIRLVQNTSRHGFGFAVRCGLDCFTGDVVVIAMADNSDHPDDIVTYYSILRDQ